MPWRHTTVMATSGRPRYSDNVVSRHCRKWAVARQNADIDKFFVMDNELYMRRALSLAENGRGYASPNPMVGAVIVAPDGRIIGEGWHRRCGEGHAEVNAVASVCENDRPLLERSTMFVTLEPCSHYGKTPPCAELIVRTGIRRVVVATADPFEKVSGRGIAMLREAGVEVVTGVLERESRELNRRFFTAHTMRRPFVTLKWAQSADGFMDWRRDVVHQGACRFSNALTGLSTMRLRSLHDAVLTTGTTVAADGCRLTVRGWDGRMPDVIVLDRHGRVPADAPLFQAVERDVKVFDDVDFDCGLPKLLGALYAGGITSVLVEAGPTLLGKFVGDGLWDAARVETAPFELGASGGVRAPVPVGRLVRRDVWSGNDVAWYEPAGQHAGCREPLNCCEKN